MSSPTTSQTCRYPALYPSGPSECLCT